jgi:riboflavin synthase
VFAGIIRGTGTLIDLRSHGGDCSIEIDCRSAKLGALEPGASVAVNGVCLTALDGVSDRFRADVSAETLSVTTLSGLLVGARVNLERSLRLGDPVDGHLVYGHVDGIGEVSEIAPEGRSQQICFSVPAGLSRFIATKGSVAVDGVSLTVNRVDDGGFAVNIIPHTGAETIIGDYAPGTTVNIEVDMMARYIERIGSRGGLGITIETLEEHGYTSHH